MIAPLFVDVTRAKFAVAQTLWLMLLPGLTQLAAAILTIALITCRWQRHAALMRATIVVYTVNSCTYMLATVYTVVIYATSAYKQVFGTRSGEDIAIGHVIAFLIVFPLLAVVQLVISRLVLDTRLRHELAANGDHRFDELSPLGDATKYA